MVGQRQPKARLQAGAPPGIVGNTFMRWPIKAPPCRNRPLSQRPISTRYHELLKTRKSSDPRFPRAAASTYEETRRASSRSSGSSKSLRNIEISLKKRGWSSVGQPQRPSGQCRSMPMWKAPAQLPGERTPSKRHRFDPVALHTTGHAALP